MTRTSRELLCGLTYADVVACAGMSQKAAAKRLGVNYCHLNSVLVRLGASHWFTQTRARKVTKADIMQVASEGYTQQDAAFLLEVSYHHLNDLVHRWHLRHLFPKNGEAQWISRRGYCN